MNEGLQIGKEILLLCVGFVEIAPKISTNFAVLNSNVSSILNLPQQSLEIVHANISW